VRSYKKNGYENILFVIEMLGKLDDNQAKASTDIKAWQEEMTAEMSYPSKDGNEERRNESHRRKDGHHAREEVESQYECLAG
jgi:hypothetical protein